MSDTDQPVVAARGRCPTCGEMHVHSWQRCRERGQTASGTLVDPAEPVATLPARCLRCDHYGNLDESGICQELGTYPVQGGESRAERCGCHCVFSAPEAGGEDNRHVQLQLITKKYNDWYRKVSHDNPKTAAILMMDDIRYLLQLACNPAAPLASTPADGEVAREVVRGWTCSLPLGDITGRHYADLTTRISTALAEARRAGTPTTADVISREAALAAMCFMCARPERYNPAHPVGGSERLFHFQGADGWNAGQCNAQPLLTLPAIQPASTPSDEVAQRARTAAEEICNLSAASEGCCVCFQSEEIFAIITKHFTGGAFNEESKKCSKCEKPPVMERDGVVWLLRCLTCGKVRSSAWGKVDLVKRWNEAQRVSEIKQ